MVLDDLRSVDPADESIDMLSKSDADTDAALSRVLVSSARDGGSTRSLLRFVPNLGSMLALVALRNRELAAFMNEAGSILSNL